MSNRRRTSTAFNNGIANALIAGMPGYLNATGVKVSTRDLRRVVEIIPDNKPAHYDEDLWDFRPMFKYAQNEKNIVDFRKCPHDMKNAVKDYALWCLENGNDVISMCSNVRNVIGKLRLTCEQTGKPLAMINDQDIIGTLTGLDVVNSTRCAYASALYNLFNTMSAYGHPSLVRKDVLKNYYDRIYAIAKHERRNHYEAVPEWYLNKVMTMFYHVMKDESKPLQQRMTAGIMLLDTQLGLRASEIIILSKDCVHYGDTPDGPRPYVVYRSRKAARSNRESVEVEHVGTDLAFETIKYLLKLRKRSPHADEDYLYVDDMTTTYPVRQDVLRRRYAYLVKQYMPEAEGEIPGIKTHYFRDGKTFAVPSIHNYRTTVFSAMADQGVPFLFIEKMMSHHPGEHDEAGYYSGIKKYEHDIWEDMTDDLPTNNHVR